MKQHKTTPTWVPTEPGAPRLHLLVESANPALAVSDFTAFADAGLDVALCDGPMSSTACPLVSGEDCPLAAGADVVLFDLGATSRCGPSILEAHGRHHPGTPVVVTVPRAEPVDIPSGCQALPWPVSVGGQINVLRRAAIVGRRRRHEDDRS